jgi:hypothetical protein
MRSVREFWKEQNLLLVAWKKLERDMLQALVGKETQSRDQGLNRLHCFLLSALCLCI